MSDVTLVIENSPLELAFLDGLDLLLEDNVTELVVQDNLSLEIDNNIIELMLDAQPGLPAGGTPGQVLTKNSTIPWDASWVSITKISVGLTAPTSPSIGDLWVDTN